MLFFSNFKKFSHIENEKYFTLLGPNKFVKLAFRSFMKFLLALKLLSSWKIIYYCRTVFCFENFFKPATSFKGANVNIFRLLTIDKYK